MTQTAKPDRYAELVTSLVATGDGDPAAFRQLYRLTSAKLFGICHRICGERQAAEDVLQEVYATVWRRAVGYEPGRSSPITWLATIAHNRAVDWRRASGRRPVLADEALPETADDAPLALDKLVADEDQAMLRTCLDRLGDDQRNAIRTAFFDGFSYSELAEQRGVPIGTMKSWVRRGLLRLRECLDDAA